ncbi:MAG: lipoprotein [Pseudomonadota bacterium]
MKYLVWLIVALGLSVAVSGCGQKGDLYFPDQSEQQRQ